MLAFGRLRDIDHRTDLKNNWTCDYFIAGANCSIKKGTNKFTFPKIKVQKLFICIFVGGLHVSKSFTKETIFDQEAIVIKLVLSRTLLLGHTRVG